MPVPTSDKEKSLQPADQLLSEDMHEIISYKPHWFIRRGNIIFLSVLLLLGLLSIVIKYPDVVNGSARIAALHAPKTLVAKTDGRLEKLLVKNGDEVRQGTMLAWLQSTASHEQVLQLKQWITDAEPLVETGQLYVVQQQPVPVLSQLGELQSSFQEFEKQLHETKQILAGGYYQQKKQALVKDKQYIEQMKRSNQRVKQLEQKDYALQKTEHDAKQQLADEKVIAPLEMNQDKSRLIMLEQAMEQLSGQLINSDASRHGKDKELLDLQKHIIDQEQQFKTALLNLKSKVDEWMERYMVIASETGRIEFLSFLEEKQLVSPGQELFFIQPANSSYYAELRTGQQGIGKIRKGQPVIIRLYGYPDNEFGYLEGTIAYVASVPNARDSFAVKVELSNGLQTTYHKPVFFRNGLAGSAEVITDDRRLVDRLFGDLKDAVKR
jgi:multidrug resistance efflux pump